MTAKMDHTAEPLLDPQSDYQLLIQNYHHFCEEKKLKIQGAGTIKGEDLLEDLMKYEEFETFVNEGAYNIWDQFDKEYSRLTEEKQYFYGCSFEIYKASYNSRLKDFLSTYSDVSQIDFIEEELKKGISKTDYMTNDATEKKIRFSLKKRFSFLQEKAKALGYEVAGEGEEFSITKAGPVNNTVEFLHEEDNKEFYFLENVHYGNVSKNEMLDFAEGHTKNFDPERVKNLRESIGQMKSRLLFNKVETNFEYLDVLDGILTKTNNQKIKDNTSGSGVVNKRKAELRPIQYYFDKEMFVDGEIPGFISLLKENFLDGMFENPNLKRKPDVRAFVFLIEALDKLRWIKYPEIELDIYLSFEQLLGPHGETQAKQYHRKKLLRLKEESEKDKEMNRTDRAYLKHFEDVKSKIINTRDESRVK